MSYKEFVRKLPDTVQRRITPLQLNPFRRTPVMEEGNDHADKDNDFVQNCYNVISMLSELAAPEEPLVIEGNLKVNFLPEFVELIEPVSVDIPDSHLIMQENTTIDNDQIRDMIDHEILGVNDRCSQLGEGIEEVEVVQEMTSEEVTGKLVESDGEESEKEDSPEESEVEELEEYPLQVETQVALERMDGGANIGSSVQMHPTRKNIRFTTKLVEAKHGAGGTIKSGTGQGKAGIKRLSQKLALTWDEMDEDYVPPRNVSAQTVSAKMSVGFPGRNATHALVLQAVNSIRKDKNCSVLTAGVRK